MCGFITTTEQGYGDNRTIRRRGEDCAVRMVRNGWVFEHFLLNMTGDFTPQPFVSEDGLIVCAYNGEIYNANRFCAEGRYNSDGECLIDLYRLHGERFCRYLDGEFAIALYDFGHDLAMFSTDAFRMKPIWFNGDGAASYESGLAAPSQPVPMNTTIIRNLKTGAEKRLSVHDFVFDNQVETDYDKWIRAFEAAVAKRGSGKKGFLGLSSGYDSGAIHCAAKRAGLDMKPYSILGGEDEDILRARNEPLPFTAEDYRWGQSYLAEHMEDFVYDIYGKVRRLTDENSAFAMAYIMQAARADGRRIYLSGQGADEIISDYGPWAGQSDFKGTFPTDLKPWGNFYGNCQEAYLAKEEHVGGAFSVETRYPFLDSAVVQAFLDLTTEAKNRHYKAPIREYLLRHNYPFREGSKLGFGPQRGLDL